MNASNDVLRSEFTPHLELLNYEQARKMVHNAQHVSVPKQSDRKQILLRLHDLILENQDPILDLIQEETGKNRASAFEEVMDVAITARHCAYAASRLLKTQRVGGALPMLTKTRIQHAPLGVVGIIAPWNYPFTLAISDALAAIAMGNVVVLKPDSQTPRCALAAAELFKKAGLPQGVFQVLLGSGKEVGQAIAEHADFLMFTGSTKTGRLLGEIAGRRLIPYSAELGGKNPLIVGPGAPEKRTIPGVAAACFSNSGQLCVSIERIYVHESQADTFIPEFVDYVKNMQVAADKNWTTDMGTLISPEHREHVAALVADAKAQGAEILAGGQCLDHFSPAAYAPTVLTNVPDTAELYREEVFGPVVYIEVVDTVEEAIRRANDTEYGLNASVWAEPKLAQQIAAQLAAGTVNINEGFSAAWGSIKAPMGGWKASGLGRRHGDSGLLKYTQTRTVAQQRLTNISGGTMLAPNQLADVVSMVLRYGKRFLR
ncbi:MAG: succinic semialdehyde dehydrogenase [Corynebacterium sp.]|nr:succinic semialdehyde dehydrogenase [Corynebacterium sp.]